MRHLLIMPIEPRKPLIALIFVFALTTMKAQIAIQPHIVMPTGYLGALLKKAPGISIGKINDFETRTRARFIGDLIYFSPRKERFDTYSTSIEGDNTTVYPGTQEIKLYMSLSFSFGVDFSLVQKEKFNWYIGPDLFAGITLRHYEMNIPNVINEREFSGILFIGIRGRTGVEYQFEKLALFLDVSRTYYLNLEASILSYNSIGLGIRF